MEFKDLFFGAILIKDFQEYRFISYCFCKNNEDPDITLLDQNGYSIETTFSNLKKEWILKQV